ncbi:MAG: hypothetical protein MJE12_09590 [Alphaproteobacteria bacterium]|nr:hypothetical protein [Alphaproteobacteria bacterium]
MSRSTRLKKIPLAIGTFAIAVTIGITGFSAAADTRHGHAVYKGGPAKYAGGKHYKYKAHGKAHGHKPYKYTHKRAHKKFKHGKASKSAKYYRGGKAHAYKHGGKKYVHKKVYKKYVYKKPVAKVYGPKRGHAYYYKPHGHKHRRGYAKAHGYFHLAPPVVRYGWAPVHRSRYYYHPPHCHPVSKTGYTRNGRKVKFGGTMCYDKYGYGYIVNGSRHIIHYY